MRWFKILPNFERGPNMAPINVLNIRPFIILSKHIDLKLFLILTNPKFIDAMLKDNWPHKKGGRPFLLTLIKILREWERERKKILLA